MIIVARKRQREREKQSKQEEEARIINSSEIQKTMSDSELIAT